MTALQDIAARLRNRAALFDRRRVAELRPDTAIASFTFDDFPRSAYETGGRLIADAGGRATYFTVGSYMGRTVDGVEQFDAGTLKAAHADGHEIGCHSFDHLRLGAQGRRFARESCDRNTQFVRDILGPDAAMTSFAYPYGDVSPAVKDEMGKRFALCRGIRHAENTVKADLAQLDVVSLEARFADRLNFKTLTDRAAARKSWLIFMSHDVSENPTPYGSMPALITAALSALKSAGIPVLTLKDAGIRMTGRGA